MLTTNNWSIRWVVDNSSNFSMSFDQFFSTSCKLNSMSYFFDELVMDQKSGWLNYSKNKFLVVSFSIQDFSPGSRFSVSSACTQLRTKLTRVKMDSSSSSRASPSPTSTSASASVDESEQQQVRKIFIRETGPPPEDPVCDSGIFCYGKIIIFVPSIFATDFTYTG